MNNIIKEKNKGIKLSYETLGYVIVFLNIIYINAFSSATISMFWRSVNYSLYLFLGIYLVKTIKKFRLDYFYVWCVITSLYVLITTLWASMPSVVLEQGIEVIKNSIMAILVYNFINSKKKLYNILWFFVLINSLVSTIGILSLLDEIKLIILGQRVDKILGMSVNAFSVQSAIAFVILICLLKNINIKKSLLGLPMLIVILLSGTRKSIIIIIIGVILKTFYYSNGKVKYIKGFIGILFSIFIIYFILNIPILYKLIGYRIEGILGIFGRSYSVDASLETRTDMISVGINLIKLHPILGYGFNHFRYIYENITGWQFYSHNNYIELIVSGGVIGFALFEYIYIYIWKCINRFSDEKALFNIILIIIFVSQFAMVTYTSRYFILITSVIAAGVKVNRY